MKKRYQTSGEGVKSLYEAPRKDMLTEEDFLKAYEALEKANVKPPYRAIISPGI